MRIRSAAAAIAVTLVLSAGGLSAQAPSHALAPGAWALQFRVADNLTLGTFSGGVISAKHHRTADQALRYGLSFATNHLGRDNADDLTQIMIGLVTHLLLYPTLAGDPGGNLHMFWGLGPFLQYTMNRVNPDAADAVTDHLFTIGAGGTIGAEWFVRQRISLSGEYQTSLGVGWGTDRWSFQFGQQGVRFGASVYFGP